MEFAAAVAVDPNIEDTTCCAIGRWTSRVPTSSRGVIAHIVTA
jgi:hypothetical protein